LIAVVASTFILTVVSMALLYPVALRIGLVDSPGGRKRHEGATPLIGGIAMFLGTFLGGIAIVESPQAYLSALGACSLLLAIGLVDDRFTLNPVLRIAAQAAALLFMFYGRRLGLTDIGDPFGTGVIELGRFALPFTLIVTLTMINAFNMVDGLDGLAGTLALIAFLSIAAVAGIANYWGAFALMIAAAIVGFLAFNFPVAWNRRRRSFMGDAGSTLLGFLVVWNTLGILRAEGSVLSPVHCLWFAAIPIYDCVTVVIRRILRKRSPFAPGRDHFHHLLRRGGLSGRQTVLVLVGLQAVYALIGIGGHFAGVPDQVMFLAWAILLVAQRRGLREIARWHRFRRMGLVAARSKPDKR
jgi:UDP-GlcNAc:undecaprenyl-phosphate GlcNAc-1-phosphate transferase